MSPTTPHSLGARVRAARERRGMSQQDLATAVGLERTMVNRIEGGQRKVTALELASIADALGTRMQSFFTEPAPAL
ncbi:helix-turn-helix domain-containing protein, partial [Fictibacillus arsenicus]